MTNEPLNEQPRQRDATIAQYQAVIAQRDAVIVDLTQTVQKLTGQLEWCRRQLFGRKSERFEDPAQPMLFADIHIPPESNDSASSSQLSNKQTITYERAADNRGRGKRQPIPDHPRREDIVHDLPEDQRIDPATGQPLLIRIGEETSELQRPRAGPSPAGIDSSTLRDRSIHQGCVARSAPSGATGLGQAEGRCVLRLVRRSAGRSGGVAPKRDRRSVDICDQPAGVVTPLPRRRPSTDRQQRPRTKSARPGHRSQKLVVHRQPRSRPGGGAVVQHPRLRPTAPR